MPPTEAMTAEPLAPALSPPPMKGEAETPLDDESARRVLARLRPAPHPIFPWFSPQEALALARTEAGQATLAAFFARRENAIRDALADPFSHEPDLPHWRDADELLATKDRDGIVLFLILLGGNRSAKSRFAGKRLMESAVRHPHCKLLCLAENIEASIETQQAILWHYLPNEWKALNGKQSKKFYIKYSTHHGFSDQLLSLPNGSKFLFKSYQQEPTDLEGQMFGIAGTTVPAVWPDENLRVNWWLMLQRRLRFQQAQLIWSFTPVAGMTPTIKEAVGDAPETIVSKPAELLADRVNVPGLPVGHMPYIQRPTTSRARVIYFWSELNRFGDGQRTFYDAVRDDVRGRSSEYVARIAYGYTRDTVGRPFPKFGAWNVVAPEHIPKVGTDYMFTDPAGARNWAALWLRVTADDKFYILADWPDAATYGEWAVPNVDSSGDNLGKLYKVGSAQNSLGLGTVQLKRVWRAFEAERGIAPYARFIDPRAGRNPHADAHGGTCLIEQLALEDEGDGGEVIEGMEFLPASGTDQETRISEVNKLLHWEDHQPFDAVANCPRLYVSREAQQVIGALTHWPGPAGGEKHAWKDFADLLCYMAMADLQHRDVSEEVCYT